MNEEDEMTNAFITDFALDDEEEVFGLDPTINPFAPSVLININGNNYYKKQSLSQPNENHSSVNVWNYLYGNQYGKLLPLSYNAEYFNGEDYFPELGIEVPPPECAQACISAQKKLNEVGLYHTDMNCTNVRKVGDEYYPIDTNKIIMMQQEKMQQLLGGKSRKGKSKRIKKGKSKKVRKGKKMRKGKSKRIKR